MNMTTKLVLVAAVAALAVTPLLAKSGGRQGTNILHFSAKVGMTNDDTADNPHASGTVTATQTTQGNTDKETLTVTTKGLQPSTAYDVFAATIGSSTESNVFTFTTDSKGDGTVKFTNGKVGKNNAALPAYLIPVSSVGQVDIIEDTNSQDDLTADLTNPGTLQFMVKQDMSTNSTTATLQLKSTTNKGTSKSSVTVTASGLTGSQDYVLVLNGTPVATNAANSKGSLKITSTDTPSPILSLTTVVVTDTLGNAVTGVAVLP